MIFSCLFQLINFRGAFCIFVSFSFSIFVCCLYFFNSTLFSQICSWKCSVLCVWVCVPVPRCCLHLHFATAWACFQCPMLSLGGRDSGHLLYIHTIPFLLHTHHTPLTPTFAMPGPFLMLEKWFLCLFLFALPPCHPSHCTMHILRGSWGQAVCFSVMSLPVYILRFWVGNFSYLPARL